MNLAQITSLLACGALSWACTTVREGAHPELPTWAHRPSFSMHLTYSRNLVAASREEGEPYERGQPELDGEGHRIFVGSSDHGLYAIDAADGHTLWRFETLGPVQSEPLYEPVEDVVYFGSNDGALYKVRAEDGALVWRFSTNAEVARRPTLSAGTLLFVNANDTLVAADPATGEPRWTQHRPPATGMEVAGHSAAVVAGDTVYFAYSDGNVAAYDVATGEERWQPIDLSAETEQLVGAVPKYLDVDTTPVPSTVGGTNAIFTGAYEGGVFALDAATGSQIWSNPNVKSVSDLYLWQEPARPDPNGTGVPRPARRFLIACTGTTGIWALDPESGVKVWQQDLPIGGISRPVEVHGALMVSTTKHGLFLLSPIDGSVIDGIHTDLGFSMNPAALGSRAFIVTNGGELLALSVEPPQARRRERAWY